MPDPTPTIRKIKVPRVVDGVETEVEIEIDDSAGPNWGPNDAHRLLNKPLRRVDGPQKVSGTAKYTHDIRVPGMLYGRILRSPYARAKVKKLDLSAAEKVPGVKAVIEAGGDLHFEGAPVAAVAAVSSEIAEDALRAIKVDFEILPHVVTADDAIQPGATQVFADDDKGTIKNNTKAGESRGDADKVAEGLKNSAVVVEAEYRTPVIHHVCLETHGVVVDYRGGEEATVYASTQGTFTIPGDSARALGLKQSNVTAVVDHMGGGFGSKFGIGSEGQLACKLSKKAAAPVHMMLTRHDEFVMAGNRSGSWQKLKGGASQDGKLLALHAVQYRLGGVGGGSLAGQPYIYSAEHSYREVASIHTNMDSSRAMRAPGHPQASFAMESIMDELADKLGMDPIEFRKKNIKDTVHHRQLDRAAKEIGWERRNPRPGICDGPVKRGFGCAVGVWGGGGRPQCKVDLAIARDGAVTVACGSQDLGTGTRTFMRAIVAEELGLQSQDITEQIGSSKLGAANASGGSTTTASLAPAVKDAAFNARIQFAQRIAPLLACKPEEITFDAAQIKGPSKSLAWKQACNALPAAGIAARGEWKPNLASGGVHGACIAEVEVDVETGAVRPIKIVHVQDVGLPLNRAGLQSQITGGVIQAMGMALWEERVMDRQAGIMVNPDLGEYKIPGSLEMPEIIAIIDDQDTREAVIGVGEPAVIPGVGAIANAVFNACGVRVRDLPITPDKILMGVMNKGKTS
ncbi:MAG: xanthine dehydrogenase family protein molybdopterin-binding subunit [Tepidisphaeraceae bacterium]